MEFNGTNGVTWSEMEWNAMEYMVWTAVALVAVATNTGVVSERSGGGNERGRGESFLFLK